MQKTILITGVSNGFGKDTALTMAAAGHRVFGTLRDPAGRNRDAAAELGAKGIDLVEMDVTRDASVVDVVLIQPSAYPTGLYAHPSPADGTRANEYGEVAAFPKAFVAFLQGIFTSADAPDPHDVATALVRLVDTPPGQRPARVVVGNPFGAADVNVALTPIQQQLIDGIGMGGLSRLKV